MPVQLFSLWGNRFPVLPTLPSSPNPLTLVSFLTEFFYVYKLLWMPKKH